MLALDESTDAPDITQLMTFGRPVDKFLRLRTISQNSFIEKGRTKVLEICEAFNSVVSAYPGFN